MAAFSAVDFNIDYLNPSDNMNAKSFVNITSFTWLMSSIIDLENANLPVDYFTSVLPRAQYGDESAVPIGVTDSKATLRLSDPADSSVGVMFGGSSYSANDTNYHKIKLCQSELLNKHY